MLSNAVVLLKYTHAYQLHDISVSLSMIVKSIKNCLDILRFCQVFFLCVFCSI